MLSDLLNRQPLLWIQKQHPFNQINKIVRNAHFVLEHQTRVATPEGNPLLWLSLLQHLVTLAVPCRTIKRWNRNMNAEEQDTQGEDVSMSTTVLSTVDFRRREWT